VWSIGQDDASEILWGEKDKTGKAGTKKAPMRHVRESNVYQKKNSQGAEFKGSGQQHGNPPRKI